jgi:uncharacterized DUF497 family protein
MTYEWDPDKALINRDKHDVSFADAVEVFSDEYAITTDDHTSHEQRHTAIGFDALGRLLVVVYTWREENLRIISARKATARERAAYGENR